MYLAVIALAVEVDGQFAFLTDLPLPHHHDLNEASNKVDDADDASPAR